jgi:hypothetical protein
MPEVHADERHEVERFTDSVANDTLLVSQTRWG